MHPLQINDPQIKAFLYRMQTGAILPKVIFKGKAKQQTGLDAGGFPVFGSTFVDVEWDLSPYVELGSIKTTQTKPIIQGEGNSSLFTASTLTLNITNPSRTPMIAARQVGGVMDLSRIEEGEIQIEAAFDGITGRLPIFLGRIQGPPKEGRHKTTFTIKDLTFENVGTPLQFDYYPAINGGTQSARSDGLGNFLTTGYRVNTAIDGYTAQSGMVIFGEGAEHFPNVTNNSPDQMSVREIVVLNGAKPGKYKLEFGDLSDKINVGGDRSFSVTYPDSSRQYGGIGANFLGGSISISKDSWTGMDGSGVVIEWTVQGAAWEGNPVSMVRVLVERMFLQNWGELPNTNPLVATLPVDWTAFDTLEREYKGFKIYADVTNPENQDWELKDESRPLSCMRFAQQCLDHIFANILIDIDGRLTVNGPRIFDEVVRDLTTREAILEGFKIGPPSQGVKYNIINLKYAYNSSSDTYGETYVLDLRDSTSVQGVPLTITLPYYKSGLSINAIRFWANFIKRRYIDHPNTLTVKVPPQYHLTAMPSDRLRITTRVQPIIGASLWEVYSVPSKSIGLKGDLKLFELQEAEGEPFTLCDSSVGHQTV